ncbi:pentatricopeptide repeat-containing protein DOT4, chloroplastic isoform X2 [Cryptomeria japonica]|uniref:pentatricopeptide repeat-containing protein DOT4, chloroplastic isoform X2 n=1 Tax=Cryptomeria japonica TaxID=3369 RepID=UPI0025AC8D11|nr:pentatricopeptide repeat-containing protein DOT4, chloroplastic isoform X2 [Cryptomeria japonica]
MAYSQTVLHFPMFSKHAVGCQILKKNADCEEALELFRKFVLSGVKLDPVMIVCILPACARLGALQQGKQIHEFILRSGFKSDIYVLNAMIDLYAKCGRIEDALHIFDKMTERDVVSWSSIIAGHSQNGHYYETLRLFREMKLAVVEPSSVTFAGVISACAELVNVKLGKEIHGYVIRSGLQMDVFVGSALIDMYSKCGRLEIARRVFDQMLHRDLVLWNSMIAGYVQNGHCKEALKLFNRIHEAGLKPNMVTLVSILPACAAFGSLKQGKEIHSYIVKGGLETELVVGCALIDMYARRGVMNSCQLVFNRTSSRDVVLWNSMICGYVQNSYSDEALKFFCHIQQSGITPDSVTLSSILPACTHLANLQKGKEIHDYAIRNGFEACVSIGNALIDMYAKCGTIKSGRYVFDRMGERDVVSWNAIIAGYGLHGYVVDVFHLFNEMNRTGMQPDYITFIALLSTCSRAGLVDKGWEFFESMRRDYEIMPKMEHYACMVDLLGRSGQLDQARDFIERLPLKPGADVYASLLGSCRVHHNVELAEFTAEQLFKLEPDNAGYYVLLSNIYATAGRWVDVEKVRLLMKGRGVEKQPGCSWIEVGNGIHTFIVGDKSHRQAPKTYETLERLFGQMKVPGNVPDTEFTRHDMEEHGFL